MLVAQEDITLPGNTKQKAAQSLSEERSTSNSWFQPAPSNRLESWTLEIGDLQVLHGLPHNTEVIEAQSGQEGAQGQGHTASQRMQMK